jgi:hypothetical protein
MTAGSEAYQAALIFYNSAKIASSQALLSDKNKKALSLTKFPSSRGVPEGRGVFEALNFQDVNP